MATKIKIGDLVELSARGKKLKWLVSLVGLCGVVTGVRGEEESLYSTNSFLVRWFTLEPIPAIWGIKPDKEHLPSWYLKRVRKK